MCGSCGLAFTKTDHSQDLFVLNSKGENEEEAGCEENTVLEAALKQMQRQFKNAVRWML